MIAANPISKLPKIRYVKPGCELKTLLPNHVKTTLLAAAIAAPILHSASAATLIHENFNYSAGSVNGAATNAAGLTGNWSAGAFATGATTAATFDAASLNFAGHFASSGGSLRLTNAGPGWGEGGAAATVGATLTGSSTLYSSSIMSFASPNSSYFNDWVVEQRFNTSASGTFGSSSGRNIIRAFGSGGGAAGRGGVGADSDEVTQAAGTNTPGANYLFVTTYAVSGSNVTSATLYTFDGTAYANYLAAATPATAEALLGTYALYSLTDNETRALSNFTFLQYTTQGGPIGSYDDYRLGTSITDVVNVVPEPSAAALCLVASLGLAFRRTRAGVGR